MNKLTIKRRPGGLYEIHQERDGAHQTTIGRTLEDALRKAAVRAGIVESGDDLPGVMTSVFETCQVLDTLLGDERQESSPTGDMGVVSG